MAIETELKFRVADPGIFEEISALREIAGYAVDDRGITAIRDTAFDTPDHALYHGAAVFRLREKDGARLMTFKAHKASDSGYFQRIEHEAPTTATANDIAAGSLPDIAPSRAFTETFGAVTVAPCLTTQNNRHILLLVRAGEPRYELALDEVTFTGPRGTAQVRELEVEALTDEYGDLEAIGRWFAERFDLAPSGPSKFKLGMELVGALE